MLDRWYRRELKAAARALLAKWQPITDVKIENIVVRQMKTKWASCVPHSRTVWLNFELAKKKPRSLEFIVVHELIHLHSRNHNEGFTILMDPYLRLVVLP